ncbi:MAG: glycyl-radical enzyme activating protein [Proteobacteria bacterium]|nr:glycyl-radical enzyme activating protein [Pseudomonadota bacterium]
MDLQVKTGIINHIQRMCTCDGPGFRTTVFLKGCLLDCQWCHNPEGKARFPEVIPYVTNCTACGDCVTVCPTGAVSLNNEAQPVLDRGLCTSCFQCAEACQESGLVVWGRAATAGGVMEEVAADLSFYKNSGGGLTVSGGEPMAQHEFVLALFSLAKADPDESRRIHTALDTCGHAPWSRFEQVLPLADLVLLDLKQMDSRAHRAYTGLGNEVILENAAKIAALGKPMRIRVPVIPGVNDSRENWQATARFVESLGDVVSGVDLLPYHPWAGGKYRAFGMEYDFPVGEGYDDERLVPVVELFLDHVKEVTVGG